jgi:hypothetical protein
VDPDGRVIVPNDDEAGHLYIDYKSEVNRRLNNARVSLSELEQKKIAGERIGNRKIRRAQNEVNKYQNIYDELTEMEESQTVFRINAHTTGTSVSAYGSTTYDLETSEVNINVGDGQRLLNENGFYEYITPMMILAHELKHGHQYIKHEIDFNWDGTQGGCLFDYTDELAAIRRGAMFGYININSLERAYKLGELQNRKEPRSYDSLTPMQKQSYDVQKANGFFH